MKKKILGKIASQPPPSVEAVKKNVVIKPKITAPPIPVKRNIPAKPKIENDKCSFPSFFDRGQCNLTPVQPF